MITDTHNKTKINERRTIMKEQDNIGIVLLAGGNSARLGTPKQLLMYKGQTLLSRMIDIALRSNAKPFVLVLGSNAGLLQKQVDNSAANIVFNADWNEGIASSIRVGIHKLLELDPAVDGVILIFCDQPNLSTDIVNNLIDAHKKTGKAIVTCSYGDTFGPPTLFHKSVFGKMLELKGDIGARNIVKDFADNVEVIVFPGGELDIDTTTDYEKISKV